MIFPFKHVAENVRYEQGILKKKHFRFTYNSPINDRDVTILLDVLFEEMQYETVKWHPIKNEFLITEGEDFSVLIPDAAGLLSDKLTAFAPHTTGISFGIGKELEIIKQLFDCGILFDVFDNYEELQSSYNRIAKTEIRYRNLHISPIDVLLDTINSCLCIASRGQYNEKEYVYYKDGILRIRNHIIGDKFNGEIAGSYACRILYLASCMITGQKYFSRIKTTSEPTSLSIELAKPRSFSYLHFVDNAAFEYAAKASMLLNEAGILQ